jgi:hypothetical protein
MIQTQVLKLTKIKEISFVAAFTALAVLTPWITHEIGGIATGKMFLPMHIFILVAGLLLGWKQGLAVGILTPLISYSLSGMPLLMLLPFITIEVAAYGLFAGIFREKLKLNIWFSLLGAMIIGRVILFSSILLLPTKLQAMSYISGAVIAGWIGIVIQLIAVPVIVKALYNYLQDEKI